MRKVLPIVFSLILFSINIYAGYCDASGNNANYEWIASVRLAFDKHTSGSDEGYGDYTAENPFQLVKGRCFFMGISPGYSGVEYDQYFGVWIDYNQDGDFEDYGEEAFLSSAPTGGLGFQINVWENALSGFTTMRVAMKWGGPPSPCGNWVYGEVEDYTVEIRGYRYTCESKGLSTEYEWIEEVAATAVSTTGNNNGYFEDYCWNFGMGMGSPRTFTLTPGFSGAPAPQSWKVWADYNKNNSFEDEGELIFASSPSTEPVSFVYDPPTDIEPNISYRLRVSMKYNSPASSSCSVFSYGEVEDYSMFISDPFGLAESEDEDPAFRFIGNEGDPRQMNTHSKIQVIPNPVHDQFSLDVGILFKVASARVLVYNSLGQVVHQIKKPENIQLLEVDVSNLQAGSYYIQVFSKQMRKSTPLVIVED